MHEHALRAILLIQAVEESDTKGELLPLEEREAATQIVLRDAATNIQDAFTGETLSRAGERLLVRRALHLHERLRLRAPITDHLLAVAAGSGARDALLVAAVLAGVLLAALDGHGYIEILSLPLTLLLAWNFLVYMLRIANVLRGRPPSALGLPSWYSRWMGNRAGSVLRRSRSFNAPLAAALPRFSSDWAALARPVVMQRATRLFHTCAALVALGLIVGLFVRGYVLRDTAGWASGFLAPYVVRVILWLLYGPASIFGGIALPASAQEVAALHVTAGVGGAEPVAWIDLIALTATLYIIVPRMLAAAAASLQLWRVARRMEVPASVVPYARRTLLATAAVPKGNEL
jgi:hypothetical protein